ncbi:substrate-binding and VWA domain-containing protein [Amycolatopsis anabasis]|uniref:substrate-binding and VWA domain-containing protein n=1 Tax=Amycolatopsis anabasis TaxID=1840409 RepID=UPI00131B8D29|nr:substrate-binding domain-containing protein [Amycolatopsis anabasis]
MGRHSSTQPRPRLRASALAAAVVVLLGLGGWFVVRTVWGSDCANPTVVRVTAAPDIAPTVTQLSRSLPGDGCQRFDVQARDSAAVAESLAISDGSERPHVWIPESTVRLQRAKGSGAGEVPELGTSVASSPVVLALTEQAARELRWPDKAPTWSDVLAAPGIGVGIPDPARDPVGVAALLGVRAASRGAPDPAAAYAAALRRLSPNTTAGSAELFARLPGGGTQRDPLSAFPASENSLLRHNVKQRENGLVAAYSEMPIPALDYPLAVLSNAGAAERAGAERLLRALLDPPGRAALADAGFRTPEGRTLRDRSQDKHVSGLDQPPETMPPLSALDELLNQWAGVNLSSRVRVLLDVSGSMNAIDPASGKTRMALTLEAAEQGLGLFKPTTKISIWTFSTALDGDKDYRQIVPMVPIGEQLTGVAEKLRGIKATPDGRTGLYDSVLAAYRIARQEWEPGRLNIVVLMTDGRNEDPDGINRADLLAELGKLKDPHRPIAIIGIGIGPDIDSAELDAITVPTGGKTFTAPDPSKIADVFYGALSKLACQPPNCSG